MESGIEDEEDGIGSEMHELMTELQNKEERLNIAADKSGIPNEGTHMITALANKIDGLVSRGR